MAKLGIALVLCASVLAAEAANFVLHGESDLVLRDDHGHGNDTGDHDSTWHIFKLGQELDDHPFELSMLFVLITILSLLFERVTHFVEHKAKRHLHLYELVTAAYRELMLLGFIALVLFFLQQARVTELSIFGRPLFDDTLFEFIHLFIFLAAIWFILIALILVVQIRGTTKHWKRIQGKTKDEIFREYAEKRAEKTFRGRWWWINPAFASRYFTARQDKQFYLVRARFLDTQLQALRQEREDGVVLQAAKLADHSQEALTSSDSVEVAQKFGEFDFGKYLRRCIRHDVVEIIEIDWRVWLVVMIFAIGNIIRSEVGGTFKSAGRGSYIFIAACYVMLILFVLVYISLRAKLMQYYTRIKRETSTGREFYAQLGSLFQDNGGDIPRTISEDIQLTSRVSFSQGGDVEEMNAEFGQIQYFWFNRPGFTLHFVQVMILLQSFMVALHMLVFGYRIASLHAPVVAIVGLEILAVVPSALIIFVFLPLLLPIYSLLSHVESLTHRGNLVYVLNYEARAKKDREQADEQKEYLANRGGKTQRQAMNLNQSTPKTPLLPH